MLSRDTVNLFRFPFGDVAPLKYGGTPPLHLHTLYFKINYFSRNTVLTHKRGYNLTIELHIFVLNKPKNHEKYK